jgi:hypothetical protein
MKFTIVALLLIFAAHAQDEWFLKDMLRGRSLDLAQKNFRKHYIQQSDAYMLDISGDNVPEYLKFENVDGRYFVKIFSSKKNIVFRGEFPLRGLDAHVYKIQRKLLGHGRVLTLFYFFEGKSSYIGKAGSAAIFGIVTENNDIKNLKMKKLGGIWYENQKRDTYIRRLYQVSYDDLNRDGQKEVIIYSGGVRKVLFYNGENNWIGL